MFKYTLTFKTVTSITNYLDQLKEQNPNITSIHYDDNSSFLQIESSSEIYGAELAVIDAIVPAGLSAEQQVLIVTVQKEEAGRKALQEMVAHMNKDGDYFTSVDQGIEGSELLWPIEAYIKRGFFMFAYRKACLTILDAGSTLFDQETKDYFDGKLRDLALAYSGVNEATLDAVRDTAASPAGGPYNV